MTQTSLIRSANHLSTIQQENASIEDLPQLPNNIKQLLQYLHQINISSNQNGFVESNQTNNKKVHSVQQQNLIFCRAFKILSQVEQRQYLRSMIEGIKNSNNKMNKTNSLNRNEQDYNCTMRSQSSCLQIWNTISMKLNKKRRAIKILFQGKVIDIYLREYLVRKSKVHPFCFVLENISLAINKQYNYHIRFYEKDQKWYSQAHEQIKELIKEAHVQAILKQIEEEQNMKQALNKGRGQIHMFLTQKNIEKINKAGKQLQQSNSTLRKRQFQGINLVSLPKDMYQQVISSQSYTIQMNQNNNTLYRAKYTVPQHHLCVLSNFIDVYKHNHIMVVSFNYLQNVEANEKSYDAFYQKIVWNQQVYGQTLASCQPIAEQQDKNSFTFSLVNIDHEDNHNFIQYLHLTVNQTSGHSQVFLNAKFTGEMEFEFGAAEAYLSSFIGVFQNKKNTVTRTKYSKYSQQQTTDTEENTGLQSKQHNLLRQTQQATKLSLLNSNANRKEQEKSIVNYLKHKHQTKPTQQKVGNIIKDHFLWSYWKRAENGGLICRDKQLVEKQKQLFKIVLKKVGQTLISGKNIINFSLPVIVFKKESHLQSLAKTYLYAPLFAQKAAMTTNPVERMKLSVVFMITENALSINMEKPFNPILGETYQGWVDGCPIYLEQISHHPPVSAYYMVGRGYKKYGSIEPKISVGLNNANGYSIYPHFVEFDDGTKIQYICAKIMIGGLLVGDRTFNFSGKIYAYDRKNRYFASLKFGPIETGIFSSSSEPQDYFHGFIYEVTAQFQKYFDSEKGSKPHPQKQHIVRKLSKFDGIWNSSININGQQILNFQTDQPYEFVPEKVPLPSDSKYRQDLTRLLAGDLQAAQVAKEEMQELQRHDRKQRQKYQK